MIKNSANEILNGKPFQGKLLIDGLWCDAADGATLERQSPAHDQLVAVYAKSRTKRS